jgi:ABC-type enterochelin transport system permease subunit
MFAPSLDSHLTKRLSAASLNPGFSERQLYINSIGQTIITSLTIIGSSYLLYALFRQGHGKLRVRLLLGMIFGDLLLGYVA